MLRLPRHTSAIPLYGHKVLRARNKAHQEWFVSDLFHTTKNLRKRATPKSAACTVRAEDFYCRKKSIVLLIQRSAGWGEHIKRHCTAKWLDFVTLCLLSYGLFTVEESLKQSLCDSTVTACCKNATKQNIWTQGDKSAKWDGDLVGADTDTHSVFFSGLIRHPHNLGGG